MVVQQLGGKVDVSSFSCKSYFKIYIIGLMKNRLLVILFWQFTNLVVLLLSWERERERDVLKFKWQNVMVLKIK